MTSPKQVSFSGYPFQAERASLPLAQRYPPEARAAGNEVVSLRRSERRSQKPFVIDPKDLPADLRRFIAELDRSDAEWEQKKKKKAAVIVESSPSAEIPKPAQKLPETTPSDWVLVPRSSQAPPAPSDILSQLQLISNAVRNLLRN